MLGGCSASHESVGSMLQMAGLLRLVIRVSWPGVCSLATRDKVV